MKLFITGASGFIGTALVPELLSAGHQVIGLARSEESARKIESLGNNVQVLRGSLDDLDTLRKGASDADGVIHLGFIHDFDNYEKSCEIDRHAAVAMLGSLEDTNKPFVYTSSTISLPAGKASNETTGITDGFPSPRGETEKIALAYKDRNVRVTSIRLPPTVHGKGDKTYIPMLINTAKASGRSVYVGDGQNVWSAVGRLDAAHLFKLVLEQGRAGGIYHGVAEQGIRAKNIAEVIGEILNVPVVSIPAESASEQVGYLGPLFQRDNPVSSELTREELDWEPCGLGLLDDMRENYRS